jgi:DNA-binding transcriptional LysR family regulator
MDFRQLRYFVAVAEELSFSRAADRLNVSQPPLSMQIKAIEKELGALLFARTKRSVTLTHAGKILLEQARGALAQLDRASDLTRRAGRGETGRLVLGFTASVPMHKWFPEILRQFRSAYPDATVDARLMSTGQQLDAIGKGQLDVGIVRPSLWFKPAAGMSARCLWQDEIYVFLPDDHPLAQSNGPISVAALADERFITFGSNIGCGLSEHLDLLCSEAGFRPRIVQEVGAASAILGLVAAGVGIAMLPACQTLNGMEGVVGRELASPNTTSHLLLAHRAREISPLLQRFLDVLRDAAPELDRARDHAPMRVPTLTGDL